MGFSLTISQGQDRGREYTFNQAEVSIGRTAENDIVLGDQGVSRKHATVREEGGKYYVQDMGSANGTKLNGEAVSEAEVQDGDQVSVGPVVFEFAAIAGAGENSTRIFNAADLEKKMAATKKAKVDASAKASGAGRAVTSMTPALKPGTGGQALAKKGATAPPVKKGPAAGKLAPASERAKARREAKTIGAKAKLWWSEADPRVQKGLMGGGAVLGLALVAFTAVSMIKPSGGGGGGLGFSTEDATVFPLSTEPSKDCWGLSNQATHPTPDKAQFSFNFPVTAKKAIATLHFSAGNIGKPEIVDITVNAVHQGFANRSSFGDELHNQDVVLTPKHLKPNEKNLLVFDNIKNPPGQESWVVCKVWVEVQQLPSGSAAELRENAKANLDVGDRKYDDRKVGARNLFDAWLSYKKAKLFLEAMEEKPDDYEIVKAKIRDCDRELDEQCSKWLLKGQAMEQTGKTSDAIANYKSGQLFFPEKDHPCYQQLRERLAAIE